jgi:hypothetical protein
MKFSINPQHKDTNGSVVIRGAISDCIPNPNGISSDMELCIVSHFPTSDRQRTKFPVTILPMPLAINFAIEMAKKHSLSFSNLNLGHRAMSWMIEGSNFHVTLTFDKHKIGLEF